MVKNKGFTLTELIAVIALLALIILIAAVSMQGIISSNKKKIFDQNVKGIIKIVDAYQYDNNKLGNLSFVLTDGELTIGGKKVENKGSFAEGNGTINVDSNGVISLNICDNDYCAIGGTDYNISGK